MAKSKTRLVSNFAAARKAGDEAVTLAIKVAVEAGADTARNKIAVQAGRRGYKLEPSMLKDESHLKDGVLWTEEWWARFFEYGTVYIPAMPFLRPGHRKARKVLKAVLMDDFEKWISKRAKVSGQRRR